MRRGTESPRLRAVPPGLGRCLHGHGLAGPDHRRAGARTHWHTHPLGQTLHVLSGSGRFQTWGEPVREIRAGDTVWIPPGEKHWHGAGPQTAMVHIAMHEAEGGTHVTWLEPVTDEQYAAGPG